VTRFSRATPDWARELVISVCAEHQVSPPLVVRWAHRDRAASSGVTRSDSGAISVVAGHDQLDQRLTLLHELAHWLLPAPRRWRRRRAAHHDARFYALAFPLYLANGLTDAEAIAREAAHYPSSLRHARALGVPGAEAAWRERRRLLAGRRGILRVLVPEHRVALARDGRWTVCSVCGQRIVGPNLVRLRRRGGRHTLLTREAAS